MDAGHHVGGTVGRQKRKPRCRTEDVAPHDEPAKVLSNHLLHELARQTHTVTHEHIQIEGVRQQRYVADSQQASWVPFSRGQQ
jgi:hypothetical protein